MSGRSARVTNPISGEVKTTARSKKPVRSFVCLSINGQKFESKAYREKPSSAAASMFSQWVRKKSKHGPCSVRILLRESTRDSLQKEYAYEVGRKKMPKANETVLENKKTGKKLMFLLNLNLTAKKSIFRKQDKKAQKKVVRKLKNK